MKNIKLILIAIIIFLSWLFLVTEYEIIKINKSFFVVKEAVSFQEKRKGLKGKDDLCNHCGMLFTFSKKGSYEFVMKDMKIPLDIIWIEEDKVVDLKRNVSENYSKNLQISKKFDKVLELRAGSIDKFKIRKEDYLSFWF